MIHHRDLTQPLSLSGASGTRPIQTKYPEYRDYLPPCNHACPAGKTFNNGYKLAQEGAFEEAWQSLIENNPLPAVHGRACYHPAKMPATAIRWMSLSVSMRWNGILESWLCEMDGSRALLPATGKRSWWWEQAPQGFLCLASEADGP